MEHVKDKGFTLLEVLVALTLLSVLFATLYGLLAHTVNEETKSRKLWENFKILDRCIKLRTCKGQTKTFQGFKFIIYQKGEIYFLELD